MKKVTKKTMEKDKVGTGLFTYKEKCNDCGIISMVDINGFCSDCYQENRKTGGMMK